MEITKKIRMTELVDLINYHDVQYYSKNTPEISDYEYDLLYKELIELETKNPELILPNSPTKRVGNDLTKNFDTQQHIRPMLSLDNTYNKNELEEWINKTKETLNDYNITPTFTTELKYDGIAISLIYKYGELKQAITRGDGTKGEVVTHNIKTIKSIPLLIKPLIDIEEMEVRGEVFMPYSVFNRINDEIIKENKPPLANPRNAAAGTLKLQDPKKTATRGLDCFIYQLYDDKLEKHSEAINKLSEYGFKTPPAFAVHNSFDTIWNFINEWEKKRHNLPLATDGIVIKVNELKAQEKLGRKSKSPKWAVAFKYKSENATTKLISVSWQVGRTGAITPVAEFEPVQLAGTTVKRATLHNPQEIERLDLHINDYVVVEKAGEIIPKILSVNMDKRKSDSLKIVIPNTCPSCNTPLTYTPTDTQLYCPNPDGCKPQIIGKLIHFASKKAMNIESLGEETIEQLFTYGLIEKIEDFYIKLNAEKLLNIKLGDSSTKRQLQIKSVKRILDGIEDSKKREFPKVLYALGIKHVGETSAEKLSRKFTTIEKLISAKKEELIETEDVGPKVAESVMDYFKKIENLKTIENLISAGLQLSRNDTILTDNKLNGISFLLSGTFEIDREEIRKKIELHGAKYISSVSKNLNYLIIGEKPGGSKLEKAKQLGIKILSLNEFLSENDIII